MPIVWGVTMKFCIFAAGLAFGAAVFGDGRKTPTWCRWFLVVVGILDLWEASIL